MEDFVRRITGQSIGTRWLWTHNWLPYHIWLVVDLPLWNYESHWEGWHPIYEMENTNDWNHQPDILCVDIPLSLRENSIFRVKIPSFHGESPWVRTCSQVLWFNPHLCWSAHLQRFTAIAHGETRGFFDFKTGVKVPRKNRKQTAWKVVKGLWVHHEQILVLFVTIPATCDRSRLFSYVFYARDFLEHEVNMLLFRHFTHSCRFYMSYLRYHAKNSWSFADWCIPPYFAKQQPII